MSKSVIKDAKTSVKKAKTDGLQNYSQPFAPTIRKELNGWGKLMVLGVWGVLAFLAGINMTGTFSEKKLADLESQMEKQFDASVSLVEDRLDEKYRYKFKKLMEEQKREAREKSEIIKRLEEKITANKVEHRPRMVLGRSPASMVPSLPKVLPYNYKNADILLFEHKQKLRKLREWQKEKEQNFLSSTNLEDSGSREMFKALQEEHEMDYYTLKRTLEEERSRFRKEKFYVRN